MERLTYRMNDQFDNPTDSIILKPYLRYEDSETRKKILNCLAAYEDTGLEPEEIRYLGDLREMKREIIFGVTAERLKELAKAEQDGRLVVLPCKVGDAVYWLHNDVITECRVHRVQMNRTGLFICLKSKVSHGAFRVDICLGKTVFLTREEAEVALKGGDG